MDPSREARANELMDLQGRLARRFLFPSRALTSQDDLPLARQEIRVLLALGGTQGCRMGELAARLTVSVSSLTAIIDRMVSKSLLERKQSKSDRRVVLVTLTDTGRRQFELRRKARLRMAEGMLKALNPREQRNFLALMRKIASHATPAIAIASLLLISSGCASVDRARETQSPSSRTLGERTPTAVELNLTSKFILTIDEAIRLALTNSPDLVQARANIVIAESQLSQAKSGYLPQLNASASYSRSKADHDGPAADAYGYGLSFSDDLFSFGRTEAAVKQARAAREAAVAQYRSTEQTVIYNVRTAFYDLYRAQELLAVDEESVREYQSHLDQARVMLTIGTRIRYDVTTAEVALGNARFTALSSSNTFLTARATLARRIGLAEDIPGGIAAPPAGVLPVEGREALLARARSNNADLAALAAQITAADAGVDAAIANMRPDLKLNAGYAWSGAAFPLAWGWSLGPSLGWTLFNGWRLTSPVDIASEQLKSARAQFADRERSLHQDLITAIVQLDTARDQQALTRLLVDQARENLDLTRERYRLGLATSVELVDAEVSLAQTRSQQVDAQRDALTAIALIRKNTGD